MLQHGSILLDASSCAAELPGIAQLTSRPVDPAELADAWLGRLAARLGLSASPAELTSAERSTAEHYCQSRFSRPEYTGRR